jgi:hypothetical protein
MLAMPPGCFFSFAETSSGLSAWKAPNLHILPPSQDNLGDTQVSGSADLFLCSLRQRWALCSACVAEKLGYRESDSLVLRVRRRAK